MIRTRVALVLFVLCACHAADGETFGTRTFVSESVKGQTLVPDTRVRVDFGGDDILIEAGCATIGAEGYRRSGGRLQISGLDFFESPDDCDDARIQQDNWVYEFFAASPAYQLDEPRLTLRAGATELVMLDLEVAEPDRPLIGPVWRVDHWLDDGIGIGGLPMATLTFAADGTLAIEGPCASGSARHEVHGDAIELRDSAIATASCPDDDAKTLDGYMREVLADGSITYVIDVDRLTLMRGKVGLDLVPG